MRALSYKQPWASLVAEGIKPIENRLRKCPQKYIGKRVLIHASAKPVPGLPCEALTQVQYANVFSIGKLDALNGPNGAIIGSVEIVDCVINHPSIWAEKQHCTYHTPCKDIMKHPNCFDGCIHFSKPIYNWVLANPIKFEKPIPCKGKQSFWDFTGIIPGLDYSDRKIVECVNCKSKNLADTTDTDDFICGVCYNCRHILFK